MMTRCSVIMLMLAVATATESHPRYHRTPAAPAPAPAVSSGGSSVEDLEALAAQQGEAATAQQTLSKEAGENQKGAYAASEAHMVKSSDASYASQRHQDASDLHLTAKYAYAAAKEARARAIKAKEDMDAGQALYDQLVAGATTSQTSRTAQLKKKETLGIKKVAKTDEAKRNKDEVDSIQEEFEEALASKAVAEAALESVKRDEFAKRDTLTKATVDLELAREDCAKDQAFSDDKRTKLNAALVKRTELAAKLGREQAASKEADEQEIIMEEDRALKRKIFDEKSDQYHIADLEAIYDDKSATKLSESSADLTKRALDLDAIEKASEAAAGNLDGIVSAISAPAPSLVQQHRHLPPKQQHQPQRHHSLR